MNGIGTWYYGKKNIHTYQGQCPHCGRYAELTSYDTTNFFVFLYIPIIPLGGKRVINQCSCCKKHHVMSLKEWENYSRETIDASHAKWLQDPNNTQDALNLLQSIVYFRAVDKLNIIAREVKTYCYSNAEVLNQLGSAHSFFNQYDEAISAFTDSLSINNNLDTQENLAEAYMKNLKPNEARPLVNHILQGSLIDKSYYIHLLIESYQYIGDHRSALEVISSCENAFPDLKGRKPLNTYRKKSEHNINSSRKIKGTFIPVKENNKQAHISSFTLPKLVLPTLLVLGSIIYLISAFLMGLSREVYLVNGLDQLYSVEINGEKIALEPMSQKVIKLPEGHIEMDISDLNPKPKELAVDIRTSFLTRPLFKRIFIINPDQAAVLLWEETKYTTKEKDFSDYEYPYHYYAGQHYYQLDGVDYLFQEFPETITMSENSTATKTHLIQLTKDDLAVDSQYFLDSLELDNAMSYLKAKVTYEPNNYINLMIYLSYFDKDQAIEFLRTRLDDRPVLVNWHRAYQDYIEDNEPSYDLQKEYASYLKNEKDNQTLYYLLGRISHNPKDAEPLFQKAIEGDTPSAHGYFGLAYVNLCNGDYENALLYAQKSVNSLPEQEEFNSTLKDAMLAQKEYDLLLADNKSMQSIYPFDGDLVAQEIKLHVAKKDIEGAKSAISNYINLIDPSHQDSIQIWNTYLNGVLSYYQNDTANYANSLEGLDSPQLVFEQSFINGDLDKASRTAIANDFDGTYFLLLYLADDNPTSASKYLSQAIYAFQKGDKTEQLLANYLLQKEEYTLEELKSPIIYPYSKRIVMASLGKLNPSYQKDLFAYAKKLNYDIDFPYHFIQEIVKDN